MPSESELASRFWDRIRVFAARRLQDAAIAEDVAQETLRRVIEAVRAGRVENPDAIAGFVFQTAKHICMHAHRSAGREVRAMQRLDDPDESAERRPTALDHLITEERRAEVSRALEALSPEDRELLRALYYEQLESAALAMRLGLTAGALRVRKHRALQRLAEVLDRTRAGETLSSNRELKR